MFDKIRRWLNGEFECLRCGKDFYSMGFGTGKMICPRCYDGEDPFLFFDGDVLLNRVWGRIALRDMDGDEVYAFLTEVRDAMTGLSNLGFSIVCQIPDAPGAPTIFIRSEG